MPRSFLYDDGDRRPSFLPDELPALLPGRLYAPVDVGGEIRQGDALGGADAVLHANERQGGIAGRDFPSEIVTLRVQPARFDLEAVVGSGAGSDAGSAFLR